MSSAYANIFYCSLPIFIPLGTIFILFITSCNAKLNNIGHKGSPCFSPVLFSRKDDNVPFILTALLVFCIHVLHIFINLVWQEGQQTGLVFFTIQSSSFCKHKGLVSEQTNLPKDLNFD